MLVEAFGVLEGYPADRTGERWASERCIWLSCEAFQVIIQSINDKKVPIIGLSGGEAVVTDVAKNLFSSHVKYCISRIQAWESPI